MAENNESKKPEGLSSGEWKGAPPESAEDQRPIERLKPGSNLHNDVLQYLLRRLEDSERKMSNFYARWQISEKKTQAYIDLPDWEKELKRMNDKGEPPKAVPVVIPYMYATISTIVTYHLHTFTGRRPIFQVGARKEESIEASRMMELVLQYNADHTRLIKELTDFLWNGQVYGLGILRCDWRTEKRMRTVVEKQQSQGISARMGKILGLGGSGEAASGGTRRRREMRTVYEGNDVKSQDPFMFFPDSRVPMTEVNKRGEFVFWRTFEGRHLLYREEKDGNLKWIDALPRKMPNSGSNEHQTQSARDVLSGGDSHPGMDNMSPDFQHSYVQLDQGTVDIIPAELGLGDSDQPEKWIFTIGNKQQILQAEPFGADHDMHPVAVTEPYTVGQGFGNPGLGDFLGPLQDMISWLINSHQDNVRKVLNDVFVVDPSKIEMQDLKNGEPGKLMRMKRSAYGTDVRTAIQQLAVQDVTTNHIKDAELFMRLGQQLSAVTENVMGLQNEGGRKTATEVRTSSEAAASRLAAQARIISAQGLVDLTEMMAMNNQQYLSEDFFLEIVGDEGKENPIHITPEQVVGDFHFPVHDGTLPLDRVALLDIWKQLFETVTQDEELRQAYSVPKMFEYIAELGGARNIESMKTEARPDSAVQQGVQDGNLVTPQQARQQMPGGGAAGGAPTGAGGQAQAARPGGQGQSAGAQAAGPGDIQQRVQQALQGQNQ